MAAEMEILTGRRARENHRAVAGLSGRHRVWAADTTAWTDPLAGPDISRVRTGSPPVARFRTPVLLAPQVMTFDGFADRILQFSSEVMRSVPPSCSAFCCGRSSMMKWLPERSATSPESQVLRISGCGPRLIAELKREEAWPDDFSNACQKRGARRADVELAGIYRAYQAMLGTHQRYDGDGRFWSARDQLKRGLWGPFSEFDLVVVDGFSDFTHTQFEILGHLAGRAQRMLVSLPLERTTGRTDLFAKPQLAVNVCGKLLNVDK